MPRNGQLERVLALLRLLARPGGAAIDELREELGVSRRTIYRDLELLGAAGAPVVQDEEIWPRRWHVPSDFLTTGGFRVTSNELVALSALATLHGTSDGAFAGAMERLRSNRR